MPATHARLARALARLPVYVSADIEDGYGDVAAGINIEDSTDRKLIDPGRHGAKIAEIKRRVPGVFVNARVDNYWLGQDAEVPAVPVRAATYVAAGANGIFVPGVTAPGDLSVLAGEIPVPVNALTVPALTIGDLALLGIRRVSTGSLPIVRPSTPPSPSRPRSATTASRRPRRPTRGHRPGSPSTPDCLPDRPQNGFDTS